MMVDTRLLPINAEMARQMSFGVSLQECRDSINKALGGRARFNKKWSSFSSYNAGQAATLLEMSGYSFHVSVTEDYCYTIEIYTSLRSEVHRIDIEPIQNTEERIQFEQGRYDALMELLGEY